MATTKPGRKQPRAPRARRASSLADAYSRKSALAWLAGEAAAAEAHAREALRLDAKHAQAHTNLGAILRGTRRVEEAEKHLRAALESDPFQATALSNLGAILAGQGRGSEAATLYRRAIQIDPRHGPAHNNLGLCLLDAGRFEEAVDVLRVAVELNPNDGSVLNNLVAALQALGHFDEAMRLCARAIELAPDLDIARLNLAGMHLAKGDFEQGWPLYEARLSQRIESNRQDVPNLPFPRWQGEPLEGKAFLIWPEQGFGDEIQFVRYAAVLKRRGARLVVVRCKPALQELMRGAAGVDRVTTSRTQIPLCDYWSPALSLAEHFGTTLETIPAELPYLMPERQRLQHWRARLPQGLKVALVWKGSRQHGNDAQRSLASLQMLAPLWDVAGVGFVSLQKGEGEDEAKYPPAAQPLVALGHDMVDFADAAAVIAQLDLVICVDTAIAHLAGALGKKVWVMLPAINTDWRWLRGRSDSPWYPRVMRLFRQGPEADWKPVIAQLVQELHAFAQEHAAKARVQSLLSEAMAVHRAGNLVEALSGYRQVLALDPDNADAWHLMGLIQHRQGQPEVAEQSIRHALALQESHVYLQNLAVLLNALGRRAEARECKARAAALHPNGSAAKR